MMDFLEMTDKSTGLMFRWVKGADHLEIGYYENVPPDHRTAVWTPRGRVDLDHQAEPFTADGLQRYVERLFPGAP